MTEQPTEENQAVSTEEQTEEAPKEVVSRDVVLEKLRLRKESEAIKDLLEYVDGKVKDLLETVICPINAEVKAMAVVLKDAQIRLVTIEKAPPVMEFSVEDRVAIVEAFKDVHIKLGSALSTLSSKEIGYRTAFDSKKGLLSVRLFKLADAS